MGARLSIPTEQNGVDRCRQYYDEDLLEDLVRSITTTSTDNSLF